MLGNVKAAPSSGQVLNKLKLNQFDLFEWFHNYIYAPLNLIYMLESD